MLVLGGYGWAFHAGFTAGYMFYDLSHYWLHHSKPRSEYGRRLRRNHYLHHFKETHARFGVSMVLGHRARVRAPAEERRRPSLGGLNCGRRDFRAPVSKPVLEARGPKTRT